MALEEWYIHVRRPFFDSQEFGQLIFSGLLDKLVLAKKERIKRLQMFAEKAKDFSGRDEKTKSESATNNDFHKKFPAIEALFSGNIKDLLVENTAMIFSAFEKARSEHEANYIAVIQNFPAHVTEKGVRWLQQIVDTLSEKAKAIMPSLNISVK
jgi:UDP-N-acetylglucosamine/UDP-N-acetylgalactosamine diphosphorylase